MIKRKSASFEFEKLIKLVLVIIVVVVLFYSLTTVKDTGDMFLSIFN
ncbi:hypothetical protein HOF78_00365 [Candidatus Woesearchaeota archaeon]|jgi:hypothetical protein|nr:hypothetical protein [Candidatus Woesearchaeota archaeon]MBT6044580.1 hypothetical protein [Candidatus Woesearchaeota archaeon]